MNAEHYCRACASPNLIQVIAEVCLLFPGLKGLKSEPIFIFPKVAVCAECGFVQSRLTDSELEKVRNGAATTKAASA